MVMFTGILLAMLFVTVRASLVRSVLDNGPLMSDVWFQATLADAYFGFLTFFVWVAWKEPTFLRRAIWFLLIMLLGNLAMSVYVLIVIVKLPEGAEFAELLARNHKRQ